MMENFPHSVTNELTHHSETGALSVARSRQLNKTEWASRRRDDENS